MRIPDNKFFDTFLKYSKLRETELDRKLRELSSGKKLLSPSDNPVDFVNSLRFKRLKNDIEDFERNMDFVKSNLEIAESTMGTVVNTAQSARVKIVNLLNTGTLTEEEANAIKNYLIDVRDYIIQQANVSIGDSRLFGGVKTQTDPFDSNGIYQGEILETTVPIAKGVELNVNFNGANYFGINYADNDGDLNPDRKILIVQVIDKIVSEIDSGNYSNLNSVTIDVDLENSGSPSTMSLLEAFDKGLSKIMEHRSMLGSQLNVIEDLREQHDNMKVNISELESDLEDVDYSQAISDLEKARTAYEALLAVIAQNKDLSLLKYYKP